MRDPLPNAAASQDEPRRVLGLWSTSGVVVGAIIGVGIFFTPRSVAATTASQGLALLAWSLGGVLALCGALVFAELGAQESGPAAQYRILRRCFGRTCAFVFGFCNLTAVQAGAVAIIAFLCADHLLITFGYERVDPAAVSILSLGLIAVLVIANMLSVLWGSGIQNATAAAKILTLLAITALALAVGEGQGEVLNPRPMPEPMKSPMARVLAAMLPVLFSFGGWQQALWISAEVKRPERNLPRGILVGVSVVVCCYLLVNWAYFRLLGFEGVATSGTIAADAVRSAGVAWGHRAVAAAVAVSALGVLNAQLLTGPRLPFAMAREQNFFAPFARLHPKSGTPRAAILLLGLVASALLLLAGRDGVGSILNGAVMIDWVFFGLSGVALFRLRRMDPGRKGFRAPLHPWIPGLFVLGAFAVCLGAFVDPQVRAAAWIGAAWIAGAVILQRKAFGRG